MRVVVCLRGGGCERCRYSASEGKKKRSTEEEWSAVRERGMRFEVNWCCDFLIARRVESCFGVLHEWLVVRES